MGRAGPKQGAENAGRPPGTRKAIGAVKARRKKSVAVSPVVTLTESDLQHLTFEQLVRSITAVKGHPPHIGIVTLLFHALQQYVRFNGLYHQLIANEAVNAAHATDEEWKRLPETFNETKTGYIVEHPVIARKIKQADQCAKLLKECMVTPWVQARLVPDLPTPLPPENPQQKDSLNDVWRAGEALPMSPPNDAESSGPANKTRRRKVSGQRAERKTASGKTRTAGDRETSP